MRPLTIAIPTYNRAGKVERLLDELTRQIRQDNLQEEIEVLVSDNASTDNTEELTARYQGTDVVVGYIRQPTNLGFDGNLLSLYRRAKTRHIWWMGSDDFPVAGMMKRILEVLKHEDPDMLSGSFRQPHTGKVFNFDSPVFLVSDPRQCIEYLSMQQKISSQVLRRVDLEESELELLEAGRGDGWMHFALAFTVLGRSGAPRLALISDYVGVCDEDYKILDWTPIYYLQMHKAMRHPFVAKSCPELEEKIRTSGYRTAIGLCFAVMTGRFSARSPEDYDRFVRDLDWRPGLLLADPGILLRFAAIKSGAAEHMRPLTRHLMPRLRRTKSVVSSWFKSR